ncbi:MAG: NUDIX hydrolase [Acidiferrobacterales bacterium]|nr:NUDIX hydrolase [Acidiferrobacterales bacterium]
MNYCSFCGETVSRKVPRGDNLPRYVCDSCDAVHYQNPKIVTGCIVQWEEKILLCRRAIDPRYGLWTIPAGFMELGETIHEAAARETYEEARAVAQIDELFAVYNIPHVSQVYCIYRAHLESPEYSPGEESLEVELFSEDEIPWELLAFQVVRESLIRYFESLKTNDNRPYVDDIIRKRR